MLAALTKAKMTFLLHRTITACARRANHFKEPVKNMVHDEIDWIAGVDGCKAGWIAIWHQADDRTQCEIRVFKSFLEICAHRVSIIRPSHFGRP
jgi:hypothetical protein